MRHALFAGFQGFVLAGCLFASISNYQSSTVKGERSLLAAAPLDQTTQTFYAADKQRIAALEAEVQASKGGAGATTTMAKGIGDGAQTEIMSMANNGKGFAMLQLDQGIKSLVIEI